MKRISSFIVLVNAIIFGIVLSIVSVTTTLSSAAMIERDARSLLVEWTESWGKRVDALFAERFAYIRSMKAFIERTLTLEELADGGKLLEYFKKLDSVAVGVVKQENFLDLYAWFAPEFTGDVQQFGVQNMKLDGNIFIKNDARYTRADMAGGGWAWFTDTEKNGRTISEPYDWEGFEDKVVSLTESIVVGGKTIGVVGSDLFVGGFQKDLYAQKILKTGYFAVMNDAGTFLFHPTAAGKNATEVFGPAGKELVEKIVASKDKAGVVEIRVKGLSQIVGFRTLSSGWRLLAVPTMSEIYEPIRRLIAIIVVLSILALIAVTALSLLVGRSISKPVAAVSKLQDAIASGDLTARIPGELLKRKDEVGALAKSAGVMIDNISRAIDGAAESSSVVLSGAQEITDASGQLSQGASEQAASMEEVSSSMEQMAANIRQNSDGAQETLSIATKTADEAARGGEMVKSAVEAVRQISQRISIIDEIARNTNLLALNAAIEAARAGESGKGFAVVASEVRKLAERSQIAAGEITTLSVETVDKAERTFQIINSIVPDIRKTAEMLQEISSASREQTLGADQINKALSQLDTVVQQNASSSEELSATATTLNERAVQLDGTVAFFKTRRGSKPGSFEGMVNTTSIVPVISDE